MAKINEALLTDIKHDKDLFLSGGDLVLESGTANMKRALLRRLVTEPGSMIHRPEYGVGLKRFQNAPNTLESKRELANRIETNFMRDERVEKVLGVSIESQDLTPESLKIKTRVKIIGFSDETNFSFTPFGGVNF